MFGKDFKFEVENDNMTEEDYFETVKIRTDYYDTKAKQFKKEYYLYSIITVSISSVVSILSLLDGINKLSITVAVLSGISAVMQTWVKVRRCHYKMVNYRHFCDYLRSEQRLYARHAGEYSGTDRGQRFVERCENIIRQEEAEWKNTFKENEDN